MQTYSGNEPEVEQSVYDIIVKNLIVEKLFSVCSGNQPENEHKSLTNCSQNCDCSE